MIITLLFAVSFAQELKGPDKSASDCRRIFNQQRQSAEYSSIKIANSQIIDVISYLDELNKRSAINSDELTRLFEHLSRSEIGNLFSAASVSTSSEKHIFGNTLVELLKQPDVDLATVSIWLSQILAHGREQKGERDQVNVETQIAAYPLEFFALEPGGYAPPTTTFLPEDVTLTYTFATMSTLVTQYHWVDIMGNNPSDLENVDQLELTEYRDTTLVPDLPVTNMTWWSAVVFANELSKKYNLKPAYDLSGITFSDSQRPESPSNNYNASVPADWDQILKIAARGDLRLADHLEHPERHKNILKTEGYRLITYAEYQYLLTLSQVCQFAGDTLAHINYLDRFAWTCFNRRNGIKPVARLEPSIIFRNPFFDVLGNVQIWTQDHHLTFRGGTNPVMHDPHGALLGSKAVTSSSILSSAFENQLGHMQSVPASEKDRYIGLRLVRTIKFPEGDNVE